MGRHKSGRLTYHSMLTAFPLALFSISLGLDIIYLVTRNPHITQVAFYTIALGIVCGFITAFFGIIDWVEIPGGTRAKRTALWHGIGNATALTLFITSWFLRAGIPDAPSTNSLIAGFAALAVALFMARMGSELAKKLAFSR